MAKEIKAVIKLEIDAGKATPSPPIGPALGQRQVNIMDFCKQFNEKTKGLEGRFPVLITVYTDKTFTFIIKKPSNSYLIKKFLKIESGSKTPGRLIIAKIKTSELLNIAKEKIENMNCFDDKMAIKILAGSARSMGIEVIDDLK